MKPIYVVGACTLVFTAFLVAVLVDPGPTWIDPPLLMFMDAWRSEARTKLVVALTGLGGAKFQIPASTLIVIAIFTRCRRSAAFLAASWVGSSVLNEVTKIIVQRPRPTLVSMVYEPRGLSFPSGHSQSTMAFAVGLAVVYWRLRGGRRRRVVLAFLSLPLVVGFTRIYLGVHYPSDVLSGWCLGAAWVMAMDVWYERVDVRLTRSE